MLREINGTISTNGIDGDCEVCLRSGPFFLYLLNFVYVYVP